MNRANSNKGVSLMELAAALFILAVIVAILLPLAGSFTDISRANEAFPEMTRIYDAVVGDPSKGNYGYVGDTGQFPSSLMDLVQQPSGTVYGWRGPYLSGLRVESGVIYDPYGAPYECYYLTDTTQGAADQFAIMSRGPDRSTTNAASSNTCTNFNGGAMSSSYGTSGNDADNVVYPRFTDNPSLLSYNHVGTLALTIFNFDTNSTVNSLVPGCPHFYTIRIESVSRGSNDSFTMPYNPGANSVDLPQGLYKVAVTTPQSQGSLWEDRVEIFPGATVSRTINIQTGFNSNTTPAQRYAPLNSYGQTLTFFWYSTNMGSVVNNAAGSFGAAGSTPRACSQVFAKLSSNEIVDSFVYPYMTSNYARRVSASTRCTLTVLNSNAADAAAERQILVYDAGLLVGVVSSRSFYKSKQIFNIRQNDTLTFLDTSGGTAVASSTMGCPTTITNP